MHEYTWTAHVLPGPSFERNTSAGGIKTSAGLQAVTAGGGILSRLRNSGAATPVATNAHAPVRKARLDGRTMGRQFMGESGGSGASRRAVGRLTDKCLDDP